MKRKENENKNTQPCLCNVEVLIEDRALKLSPSLLEMDNTLRRLFQTWEDTVYAFELFANETSLHPYVGYGENNF
jgi:hypothetical protein